MNRKTLITVIVIVGVLLIVWLSLKSIIKDEGNSENEYGDPTVESIDVTLDFMSDWLELLRSTSTSPYAEGLHQSEWLTESMRSRLAEAETKTDQTIDPVLCQETLPDRLRSNILVEEETETQIRVIAHGTKLPGQAVVHLVIDRGEWRIDKIECSFGETDPNQGEYDFEHEGQLLKGVPVLADQDAWYLIYGENGVVGYTAKLIFNENSMCTNQSGEEGVCSQDSFTQTAAAFVQGDGSEAGIVVIRLELK